MMVLDHVGDQEAMLYAQLGQHPLARTTATSLEPRRGTLSCLSARPPDLADDAAITRPRVVSMFLSSLPFVYSKRVAGYGRLNVLCRYEHTSRGTTRRLFEALQRAGCTAPRPTA